MSQNFHRHMGHVLDRFKAVPTATQVGVFLNVLSALGKATYEPLPLSCEGESSYNRPILSSRKGRAL